LRRYRRQPSALQVLASNWRTTDGTGTTTIITTGIAALCATVTGIEATATAICIAVATGIERTGLQSPCFELRTLPCCRPHPQWRPTFSFVE